MGKIVPNIAFILIIIIFVYYWFLPLPYYNASDFEIEVLESNCDYDNDGVDDYMDIMLGARIDAENHPIYDGSYVSGGYPDDNRGVCADVIWRAFKNAGYILKDMIDEDIRNSPSDYPGLDTRPDPNIDFRRVVNLDVYFKETAINLTTDITKIDEWQGGDIIVFKKHIGIVSDKRNKNGIPFIIHHANPYQIHYEEDILEYRDDIIGHYRIS